MFLPSLRRDAKRLPSVLGSPQQTPSLAYTASVTTPTPSMTSARLTAQGPCPVHAWPIAFSPAPKEVSSPSHETGRRQPECSHELWVMRTINAWGKLLKTGAFPRGPSRRNSTPEPQLFAIKDDLSSEYTIYTQYKIDLGAEGPLNFRRSTECNSPTTDPFRLGR